jgi:hypothetical protein
MSLSSINHHPQGSQPKALRSGVGATPNQQSSEVALPQSNGVNITIINPTTNVCSTAGSEKLTPNPADSFTPSTSVASNTSTIPALQPLLPPTSASTGDLGFQQQPTYY